MLEVGTKAPVFTLPDQNGKLHSLEEYRGKKLFCIFIQEIILPAVQSRLVVTVRDTHSLWKKVWKF